MEGHRSRQHEQAAAAQRLSPDAAGAGLKDTTPAPTRPTSQLHASWDRDLDNYLKGQGSTPSAQRTQRSKLAEAVRVQPESPDAWWAFLQQEEAAQGQSCGGSTATLTSSGNRSGVGLSDLYQWATRLVPRQGNHSKEVYVQIWLGYARQQWYKNQDDARDTFKTLRSQHVGDRSAALYYEWAALEQMAGNTSKAVSVLQKGLREQAQPVGLLEQMQQELQQGKFLYRPPWAHNSPSSALTGHSNGSTYAAFLTPGVLDGRRPAGTPTEDGSQLGSQGSTETLALVKAASDAQAAVAAAGAQQKPQHGSAGQAGIAEQRGEQDTVVVGTRARSGSTQHTSGSLADRYNRTSHTINSGSSGATLSSMDGSTVPLRTTPCAGISNNSNNSTGSIGEEATVSLRKPSSSEGAVAGVGPGQGNAAGRPGKSLSDETVIVNRAALQKAAVGSSAAVPGGPAKDPTLPKPRRMGMLGLGRAMRVTPGSAPATEAAAAPAVAPATAVGAESVPSEDATRKRKADGDAAHSPKPQMPAGDYKRRSPQHEVKAGPCTTAQPSASQIEALPAAQPRPRQLPPVPRFDGGQAPAASRLVPAHTAVPTALPAAAVPTATAGGMALPTRPTARPVAAAAPAGRQQVVLKEGGEAGGGSDDETVPHVMSKLALKIAKGRQSLAPSKIVMRADGAVIAPGETTSTSFDSQEGDDAPTLPVQHLPPHAATQKGRGAAKEDPDGTLPLSKPAGARVSPPRAAIPPRQVQIDGSGNVKLQGMVAPPQPAPVPRRMPVPPPPPPSLPPDDSDSRPAAALAASGPLAAQPARVPMGPPAPMPPKHLRQQSQQQQQQQQPPPSLQASEAASQQQQQQSQQRRIVEDENTIMVKGIVYTKLECVGRGGSSKVYKVMAPNRKIFALKRIRLSGRDKEAAIGFLDEITLLNKLKGRSNIIQLIDSEVVPREGLILMVLECGDIDLARLLQKHEKARQEHVNADEVDENFIRLYWEQMLQAVYSIHEERIVHSDLKPANFLMVEGQLKLIDFGIAKAIQADTTSIARESQVGTLNYMSPEAILGGQNNIRGGAPMKVGRPSDVWSLGCILYQMVYGHTPFSHLPFIQKMHAIIDPNHRVSFPPIRNRALMDVMQRCLDRDPRTRVTMKELLEHPFLRPTQAAVAATAADPSNQGGSEVRLSREQLTKLLLQVSQAGVANTDVGQLSEELFRQMASGLSPNVLATKVASASAQPASAAELPSSAATTAAMQQQQSGSGRVPPVAGWAGSTSSQPAVASGSRQGAAASNSQAAQPQQQHRQQQQAKQQQRVLPQRAKDAPASLAEAAAQAAAARTEQRAAALASVEGSRARAAGSDRGRAPLATISQAAIQQQAAGLRKVEPAAARPPDPPKEGGLEAALRKGLERFKFDDITQGTTAHCDDTSGDFSLQ